ncbi:uncharacterized protein LOC128039996 [Gossypium raimondii]|uniref:uncharacterized protein LOC128039996 n=1 Tax=Gossypium raimondii TaxID=29730 RepID=UPI00227AA4A1|nr:uncharacterized protein LOC128039996 [Gossypium raimondii]
MADVKASSRKGRQHVRQINSDTAPSTTLGLVKLGLLNVLLCARFLSWGDLMANNNRPWLAYGLVRLPLRLEPEPVAKFTGVEGLHYHLQSGPLGLFLFLTLYPITRLTGSSDFFGLLSADPSYLVEIWSIALASVTNAASGQVGVSGEAGGDGIFGIQGNIGGSGGIGKLGSGGIGKLGSGGRMGVRLGSGGIGNLGSGGIGTLGSGGIGTLGSGGRMGVRLGSGGIGTLGNGGRLDGGGGGGGDMKGMEGKLLLGSGGRTVIGFGIQGNGDLGLKAMEVCWATYEVVVVLSSGIEGNGGGSGIKGSGDNGGGNGTGKYANGNGTSKDGGGNGIGGNGGGTC